MFSLLFVLNMFFLSYRLYTMHAVNRILVFHFEQHSMFMIHSLYTCSCCISVLACWGQRNSSGTVLCRRLWAPLVEGLPGDPWELLKRTSLTISAGDLNTKGRSGCKVLSWGGWRLFGGLYPLFFGKRTLGSTLEKSGKGWLSCPFLRIHIQQ